MPRMSQEWLNAYEAKMRGKHPQSLSQSPGVEKESKLHAEILEFCRQRGWVAFHGSMAKATGRTIGEPDFQIYMDKGEFILIECKTGKGKLTTEQMSMQAWLEKLGHTLYVVRSFDDFLSILRDLNIIK